MRSGSRLWADYYDPEHDTWTPAATPAVPRNYHLIMVTDTAGRPWCSGATRPALTRTVEAHAALAYAGPPGRPPGDPGQHDLRQRVPDRGGPPAGPEGRLLHAQRPRGRHLGGGTLTWNSTDPTRIGGASAISAASAPVAGPSASAPCPAARTSFELFADASDGLDSPPARAAPSPGSRSPSPAAVEKRSTGSADDPARRAGAPRSPCGAQP